MIVILRMPLRRSAKVGGFGSPGDSDEEVEGKERIVEEEEGSEVPEGPSPQRTDTPSGKTHFQERSSCRFQTRPGKCRGRKCSGQSESGFS